MIRGVVRDPVPLCGHGESVTDVATPERGALLEHTHPRPYQTGRHTAVRPGVHLRQIQVYHATISLTREPENVDVLGLSLLTVVVVVLLVAGVITGPIPKVKGGTWFSLIAVYLYWWGTGYSEPSFGVLGLLTVVLVLERAGSLFGPVLTARIGGVSPVTTTVASFVGGILFFFTGLSGFLVGLAVTAFLVEYLRRGDVKSGAVAAVVVVLSTFAERIVKVLVTLFVLVVMLAVILL